MTSSERAKDARLRKIYKTTLSKQNKQRDRQNDRCAICTREFSKFTAFQDHLHKCCPRKKKEFCGRCNRGLLCYLCNKFVVGIIEKQSIDKVPVDPIKFTKAILVYLEYWKPILEASGAYEEKPETPTIRKKEKSVRRNNGSVSKR